VSRDGTRLAYSTVFKNADIVLRDLRSGRTSRVPSVRGEYEPALAPDGRRLVFTSDRLGTLDLWSQDLSGGKPDGAPRRLTDLPGSVAHPEISPDGKWIAYYRVVEGQRDIWIIPSGGGLSTRFTEDHAIDIHPTWAPDGSRIAFVSDRDGHKHLWAAPIVQGRPAGPALRITYGDYADSFPAWSPDGSSIAFLREKADESDVWVVSVHGTSGMRQVTRGASAARVAWGGSSDSLLVCGSWRGDKMQLRRVSLASGEPRPLDPPIVLGDASAMGNFSTSADGSLIAFVREEMRGDVWVLESNERSF
jgi:TolB protein